MADDQNLAVDQVDELPSEAGVMDEAEASGDEALTEPLRASLTVKRGGVKTEDVFTFQSPAIVGRFDPAVGPIDVDLGSLPEASYVSRKHAKVTLDHGVWKLTDLGSSNGTFILRDDFERVEEVELADGDEIALGNARMVFKLEQETQ